MANIGDTAIVLGRSMAGLAAAAALVRRFEHVIIVEKDAPAELPEARPGVGQGHHLHNLLQGGQRSIEKLLPSMGSKLLAAGAVPIRFGLDVRIYDHGIWLPPRDLGYDNLAASRPLLEHTVFQEVRAQPGVRVRSNTRVDEFSFDASGRVNGVRVHSPGGEPELLSADLVIDCSGRTSRTSERLTAQGCEAPQEFKINIGVSYTSAVFDVPPGFSDEKKGFVVLPNPPNKRGCFVGQIEGGEWLASFYTRFEKQLPQSQEEMLAFATEIETPDASEFLARAKIVSPVRSYRKPDATWRRYDKLTAFPDGLLVLGDAMTSFNPVFGQGMSVAWLQAVALDGLLQARQTEQRGLAGLAKDYFAEAMRISREAWNGSTLIDAAYEEVTGDKRPGSEVGILYLRALRTLLAEDPDLHADYIGVGQMTTPGAVLTREDRLPRVMAAASPSA